MKSRLLRRAAFVCVLSLAGCAKTPEPPSTAGADSGRTLFAAYCAPCHHPEGLGTEGGPPPLVGSPWVAGPDARLIRIVLHGVHGSLEVVGKTYSLEMPAFGRILDDAQIAALLSFVRRQYSRSSTPITPAAVSGVRRETRDRDRYWTQEELLEVR